MDLTRAYKSMLAPKGEIDETGAAAAPRRLKIKWVVENRRESNNKTEEFNWQDDMPCGETVAATAVVYTKDIT